MDLIGATLFLVATAPLMAVLLGLVALEVAAPSTRMTASGGTDAPPDAGSPLDGYRRPRTTRGNPGDRSQCADEWDRNCKLSEDPRITAIGPFVADQPRRVPQLWNVLRGEMSLVGPRPITRQELLRYGQCGQALLLGPSGLTGLWQVRPENTTYEERVAMDCHYIENLSILRDLVWW